MCRVEFLICISFLQLKLAVSSKLHLLVTSVKADIQAKTKFQLYTSVSSSDK